MFKIKKQSKKSKARRAVLTLNHGRVQTPFFMPIATVGAVKQLSTDEVRFWQEVAGSDVVKNLGEISQEEYNYYKNLK